MKVLHAIHDFLPRHCAGSEIYALHLAREQQRRGHQVAIACAEYSPGQPHGALCEREHEGLPVYELNNLYRVDTFEELYRPALLGLRLAELLERLRPDVLHLHNLLNLSFDLPALAASRRIPAVATLHDYTLVCASGGQRLHLAEKHLCERLEPERCARCFAQSPFAAQWNASRVVAHPSLGRRVGAAARALGRHLPTVPQRAAELGPARVTARDLELRLAAAQRVFREVRLFVAPVPSLAREYLALGVPPEKLVVSDYGFPAADSASALDARATTNGLVPRRPLRLGFVGTLAWHKGAHLLVEAARQLPLGAFEVHVHGALHTAPAYAAELQRAATGLPVTFHGGFDPREASRIYRELDALVVPSLWLENSPLVVHEAFQHRVPVVAARLGGLADLVTHEQSGLLYEARSAPALAGALRRLLDEPGLRDRLARGAPEVKSIAEDAAEWDVRYRTARQPPEPAERERARTTSRARRPAVSVVIPTFNGMATLPAVLSAVRAQQGPGPVEIVAVDSGSTDGTAEFLRTQVDALLTVPPETFDHGLTRNLGLERARAPLVALLTQDAEPFGNGWLRALVHPLEEDDSLAGSFARQQPRPDASVVVRRALSQWVAARSAPHVSRLESAAELERLPPLEQLERCAFDNVSSCVRRSVWERIPFRASPIAEDLAWGRDVLIAGYGLAYCPDAVVLHSHERTARYEFWRAYLAHRRLHQLFGLRTVPGPATLGRAVASTLGSHLRAVASAPERARPLSDELSRAISLAIAWPLGQFAGGLSARTGVELRRPRGI